MSIIVKEDSVITAFTSPAFQPAIKVYMVADIESSFPFTEKIKRMAYLLYTISKRRLRLMFKFPWTNFHELNLDWILHEIKKLGEKVEHILTRLGVVETAVEGFDERIDAVETAVGTLDERLNAVEVETGSLDDRVETLEDSVVDLGERVESLEDAPVPVATSTAVGGIKADPKQSSDTTPVRIGTDGKLYTSGGGGTGGGTLYEYRFIMEVDRSTFPTGRIAFHFLSSVDSEPPESFTEAQFKTFLSNHGYGESSRIDAYGSVTVGELVRPVFYLQIKQSNFCEVEFANNSTPSSYALTWSTDITGIIYRGRTAINI